MTVWDILPTENVNILRVLRNYIPISVVFKRGEGIKEKIYLKTFFDLRCPDKLITKRTNLLPKDCVIMEIAVGAKFHKLFQKKYKIKL